MSESKNGSKQAAQRRTYHTQLSPYRVNPTTIEKTKAAEAKTTTKAVENKQKLPAAKSKKGKEENTEKRDADPGRRILKDKQEGEFVVKFYRRSKWHIVYIGVVPIIITILTIVAFIISLFVSFMNIIALPLLVVSILWWAWTIIDWANDYLIMTNRRFIHVERLLLMEQMRNEIRVAEFAEVKLLANRGSLEFAFKIGTIVIEGKKGNITFNHVADPLRVYREIDKDFKDYRASRRKERDVMMDNYFMAKAHNQAPPRPTYTKDIPHLPENVNLWRKITEAKPIGSTDEMKRQQFVWRKHPILLLRSELMPLFLGIIYIVALVFLIPLLFGINAAIGGVGIIGAFVGGFALFAFLWYRYTAWDDDIYILNSEEVIDSEKRPFGFDEFKDRIKLANIQQIKYVKHGFVANMFNYGNVLIDRTGGNKSLTFHKVPNPELVQQQLERWIRTRTEITESMDDERQVDFLIRHRHNLMHLLDEE